MTAFGSGAAPAPLGRAPRVAIVAPLAGDYGGAEIMLLRLLEANRSGPGVRYRVAFLEPGPLVERVRALGYPAEVLTTPGRLREVALNARAVARIRRWLLAEPTDLVMSWLVRAHLFAGPAALLAGIPSAWWQHNYPMLQDRLATLLPARVVFCCSRFAESGQRAVRPVRPTRVVNPAVDLARFDPAILPTPAAARAQLGLPSTGPLVAIFARLQHKKGAHVLVEAAARLTTEHPGMRVVVVGRESPWEPGYVAGLHDLVGRLGMSDRVIFQDHTTDPALWMQAMDVVVLATVDAEPFGMVVVEAMALGKPVVASGAGGPLEIITDGVDGRLHTPGDASSLARVLGEVLSDRSAALEMGEAARETALRFGADRLAVRMADAVRDAIAGRRLKAPA